MQARYYNINPAHLCVKKKGFSLAISNFQQFKTNDVPYLKQFKPIVSFGIVVFTGLMNDLVV